jgi:hypothetical protein
VTEQPVNVPTPIYLGVFSRAKQRVCRRSSKAIAEGGGKCVAALAMLARDSNTSKSTTRNAGNSLWLENGAASRITRTSPIGLARIMARTMLSAMHREETLRTLPALLVLAVSGTTAGADTAVMRPPPAGAERIIDAKQVMQLAAIVRSTGYACQEGIFVAYKLPREADAQRFEVMCLGNGALGDQPMRHYMLQIQDDASLAVESRP